MGVHWHYAKSKAANVMFARQLSRNWQASYGDPAGVWDDIHGRCGCMRCGPQFLRSPVTVPALT